MPYIAQQDRDYFNELLDKARYHAITSPGELNFLITKLVLQYIERKGTKYQHWNDAIGALECCKLEMYRRFVGPYEDKKIAENGDVV